MERAASHRSFLSGQDHLDQATYASQVEEYLGDKLENDDLPILRESWRRNFGPMTTAHRIIANRYGA